MTADELAAFVDRRIAEALGRERRIAHGEVVSAAPFTVRFNGDTTGVEGVVPLGAYGPIVSDTVLLVRSGSTWFAVGDY